MNDESLIRRVAARATQVKTASRANIKKMVTDYYEKPEDQRDDPTEMLDTVKVVSRYLDEAAKKLAAETQRLSRFSDSLKQLKQQLKAPNINTPLEVEGALQEDIKKADASLAAVEEALDNAAKAYSALADVFMEAENAVRERDDELSDLHMEAQQALKKSPQQGV
jgi:septation ring formation regulator EzrA